jgi:hypothetical protein
MREFDVGFLQRGHTLAHGQEFFGVVVRQYQHRGAFIMKVSGFEL